LLQIRAGKIKIQPRFEKPHLAEVHKSKNAHTHCKKHMISRSSSTLETNRITKKKQCEDKLQYTPDSVEKAVDAARRHHQKSMKRKKIPYLCCEIRERVVLF